MHSPTSQTRPSSARDARRGVQIARAIASPALPENIQHKNLACVKIDGEDFINGRGIPVKYWDVFYKKRNRHVETDAWKAIKVQWGNWKVRGDRPARISF